MPAKLIAFLRQLGWRFWATFLIACAISEGGELLYDHWRESKLERGGFQESVLTATGLYQQLLVAPRRPVVKFTSIVEIDPHREFAGTSASNVCAEREFVAQILRRIDALQPSMIVIDKYFGRDSCAADDPGTRQLVDAVTDIRKTRPVLVAVRLDSALANVNPPTSEADPVYVAQPPLALPSSRPWRELGIVNIAPDNRRVLLDANVIHVTDASAAPPLPWPTLAFAAASLHEPNLLEMYPRLARLHRQRRQPFIGFLDEAAFKRVHYYASDVLCRGMTPLPKDWHRCSGTTGAPPPLLGRIVLIGENNPDLDEHRSVVGPIAGFYLQANYIEALLDDRYFTPAGPAWDFATAFVFLLGMQLIIVLNHGHVLRSLMMIVGLTAVLAAVLYLLVLHFSVYVDPVSVTLSAILVRVLHLAFTWVQRGPEPAQSMKAKPSGGG